MRNLIYLIIGALVIIITCISFSLNSNYTTYSEIYNNDSLLVCLRSFEYEQLSRGNEFPGKIDLVEELKNDTPVLCLRIADMNCSVCIDRELNHVLSAVNEKNLKILLIGSFINKKNFKIFSLKCKNMISLYEVSHEDMNWEIDKLNVPYYFILYPDLKTSDFFIPEKSFPAITEQYFDGIRKLLYSSI